MKVAQIQIAVLVVVLTTGQLFAKSTAKGGASINGNRISFEMIGESMVNVSAKVENDIYQINATIDGTEHQITVSEKQIDWDEKSAKLNGFKKIEIKIDGDVGEFLVDGKKVILK